MPAHSSHLLGGWTQTSSAPNPLCRLLVEEGRRNLTSRCFKCGGDHWASRCNKPSSSCPYNCASCGAVLQITSRGQSVSQALELHRPSTDGSGRASPCHELVIPDSEVSPDEAKLKRFDCVQISGKLYAFLGTIFSDANSHSHLCRRAISKCASNAVEMSKGDFKTLLSQGFAKPHPRRGVDLLPAGAPLTSKWRNSCSQSVKSTGHLKLRLKPVSLKKCRGILWQVDELSREFPRPARPRKVKYADE